MKQLANAFFTDTAKLGRGFLLIAIVLLATTVDQSFGATKTWTGATSAVWATSTNWSPAGAPANNDDVIIGNFVPGNQPTLSVSDTVASLTLNGRSGTASTRAGLLTINTGITLTVTGNVSIVGSTGGGTASTLGLALSGTASMIVGGSFTTTNSTAGPPDDADITMVSGSITVKGNLSFGTLTTITPGTGTFVFNNAAAAQSLTLGTPASQVFNNVTVSTGTTTLGSILNLTGTLTISGGATLSTSGSNFGLGLAGNFSKSGTLTAGSSTITLSGTASQALDAFTTTGSLTISKTSGTATLNGNSSVGSATFSATGATLSVATGITLTVTNALTLNNAGNSATVATLSGAGTISAGSIALGNATPLTSNNNTSTTTLSSTVTALNVTGNVTLNGYFTATNRVNNPVFNLQSGKMTVGGAMTTVNANASNTSTVSLQSGAATGYLKFTNATPWSLSGTGSNTLSFNGTADTVEYAANNTSVAGGATYDHLVFSGTGTVSSVVNGNISIVGNLINNGTIAINFGSADFALLNGNTQSIAGFTTTGAFGMNKASGTATMGGNFTAGSLVINGTAGTLDLGTSHSDSVTGAWSRIVGTLNCNSSTLKIGGATTNTGGTFTAGTGTVEYFGAAQTIGTVTYNNLKLSGSGAKTNQPSSVGANLTVSGGTFSPSALTITGLTTVNGGTLSPSGALTMNGGYTQSSGTFTAGSLTHNVGGDFSVSGGTFTNTGSTFNFNGSSAQSVGGGSFNALTLNNQKGITLTSNETVGGTFTFTLGNIRTGANTLTANGAVNGANSTRKVIGNLAKSVATGANVFRAFEVGDSLIIASPSVTFANVTGVGTLTGTTASGDHASLAASNINPSKSVNRTWKLTNSGTTFDTYSATFNWAGSDTDISSHSANYIVGKYNSPNWTYPTVSSPTTTSITATGLSSFSDFAVGESNAHTITVSFGSGGAITPGTGSVSDGATPTYTITPSTGHHVADVLVNGSSVGAVTSYTFGAVHGDSTISATFAINTYTVTVTAGSNGSITPGTGTANYGDTPTYTITPATGHHIVDVLVNGSSVGAVGSYQFGSIQGDSSISATFAINTYTVTVTAGSNGSITPGTGTANYGDTPTYTITPATGHHIVDVLVNGSSVGAVGSYQFGSIQGDSSISATFAINTYTVTVTAGSNGSITPGTGTANYGDTPTYTITPATGHHIVDVLVNGSSVGAVGSYQFGSIQGDSSISATFAINTYTVTVTAGSDGSITPGTGSANYGDTPTYTITPATGYHVADVLVNGSSVGAVGSYQFAAIQGDSSISATFAINTYTVTVTAGANGSIVPGTGTINYGDTPSYTITPDAHYHIVDVLVNGVSQGPITSYTFGAIHADSSISATFTIDTYDIVATSGANGSIDPSGTVTVNYGDNQVFTASANQYYLADSVYVDGVPAVWDATTSAAPRPGRKPMTFVGDSKTYTFNGVSAGHTIHVTFVRQQFSITASAGANGSINPSGTMAVDAGTDKQFDFTPATNYHVDSVIVDGNPESVANSYTFNTVTGNHTIRVVFGIDQYTITTSAGSNGSISPAGTVQVSALDDPAFTITPDNHYHIVDVHADTVSVGAVSSYTFTDVLANHTLSASFAIDTFTVNATASAGGSISPAGLSVRDFGGSVSYTITASANHHIDSVVVDGVNEGAITSRDFTSISANHTIAAYFSITKYTITATAGSNGSIAPSGSVTINSGTDTTFTITPATNYQIADVLVDGSSVGAVSSYQFTGVVANHTISATFSNIVDTIWASAGANGSISPTGTVPVNRGADQTFTVSSNLNYVIDSIIVDGTLVPPSVAPTTVKHPGQSPKLAGSSVGETRSYTFTSVSGNHTIRAVFAIKKWTITASAGTGGSISPNGTLSVNAGSNNTFTITPTTGYHIQDVLVDGSSVGAVATYDINNVTANHTIAASFEIDTLTITASAGAGGSVNPAGAVHVLYDGSQTFTITPESNHTIVSVFVDTVDVGALGSYTFNNVIANHTISATFKADSFNVTTSAGTGGSVSPNGTTRVQAGDSLVITVTPTAAYTVDHLVVNGNSVGAASSYTFRNILGDSSLNAVFLKKLYNESITTGNWSSASTWSFNTVPGTGDSAVVRAQDTVTIATGSPSVGALAVNGRLVFSGANRALTVTTSGARSGNVWIGSSAAVDFQEVTNQRLVVFGNFANLGTLTNLSFGNGSQIAMQGSGIHTFSSSDSVGVLRLNGATLQLKLLAPLTISTNVLLSAGKLYLGANNLTLDTVTANIDSGTVSSYVVTDSTGRIIRKVAAGLTNFPVGTSASFNPVKLRTGIGSDIFHVSVIAAVTPTSANNAAGLNKTFAIDRESGDFIDSTTMTWSWTAADEGAQFTRSSAVAWRSDGGPWVEDGYITKIDSASGRYTATVFGITTFSNFILGNPGALPVQLAEFSGATVAANTVKLLWNTVSEEHSYGFYVERRGEKTTVWERLSNLIPGAGTTLDRQEYNYTDSKATATTYYYRLRFVDLSGTETRSQEIKVSTVLGVEDREPLVFKLNQNYPNPFNPSTTIKYSVPNAGFVSMIVYNMLGQEVAHLVDGFQVAGRYTIQWNASNVASGQYFYRLMSGTNMQVKRLMLVK